MGWTTKLLDPAQTGQDAQRLEAELRQRIVGQDEAIESVIQAYQADLASMSSPGRPIANLLFLGPTGSGKTRLVEAAAESLFDNTRAVIKIDCAEFQHSHEIAKLIGSPPGYLGHRETHPLLTQEALNQFKLCFVLFDEIEKASDSLWNLLLGILDKATLTLGDNRRVDFSRAMIFMTSNLGAREMSSIMHPHLGFAVAQFERDPGQAIDQNMVDKISRAGVEAARHTFSPEFMNRIDRTVVFRPLGAGDLRRILSIELNAVQQRVMGATYARPFVFKVTEPGKEYLLRKGTDPKYGARHLKRAIERYLVCPLANLVATEQVKSGDLVWVDFDEELDALIFSKDASWSTAAMMARLSTPAPMAVVDSRGTAATAEAARRFRPRDVK
jgi:ATP-dependent Clp protease ATP-binding subunit ClpA